MKRSKIFIVVSLLAVLFGMSACSNSSKGEPASKNESKVDNMSQDTGDSSLSTDSSVGSESSGGKNNESEQSSSGSDGDAEDATVNEGSENSVSNVDNKKTLTHYSNEQMEYARVWLQLGANQDLDGLYALRIPAGTPLNPNDDSSASYPEDVIQLAGIRLVDGSVTYSGNGDGTINVYNVPLRWDGKYPAGERFYIDIIENTKLVSIDPGDDENIIELIKLLHTD